jgi:hypothetical protein
MGLDMWLPSVFDFTDADAAKRIFDNSPQVQAAQAAKNDRRIDPLLAIMALSDALYDAMRATGGYYRDGHNRFGLFAVLGMSWDVIIGQLHNKSIMPVEHVRFLLAELEARPVTVEMIERRARGDSSGLPPIVAWTEKEVQPYEAPANDDQIRAECERAYDKFAPRQKELMALLRLAIERNEPLRISG